jgi:hypothetical protein
LGECIDKARLAGDPVELASAANLLEAAESVSGKKAKLTAASLFEEAAALAKLRANLTEVATVAKLAGGDVASDLEAFAKEEKTKQAEEEDEEKRDLDGDLIVDNHTHSEVHVYVNGHEIGHVHEHGVARFHVHHAHEIDARDHNGHRWHVHIEDHRHVYRMVLEDPHHPHF